MSVKLRITVTKEMILTGECRSPNQCAIAKAIKFIFPDAIVLPLVGIFTSAEKYRSRYPIACIKLPDIAAQFIVGFDNCYDSGDKSTLDPISFEIEIPEEIVDSTNIDELKPLLQNYPTLELIEA